MQKILVVVNEESESIEGVVMGWGRTLVDLGYEIFFSPASQAIEIAKTNSVDLVIIDGSSLKSRGLSLFNSMRGDSPILVGILLINDTNPELVMEAMDSGFSRVCRVPVNEKKLIATVKETLEITDLRDDISRMNVLLPLYKLGQNFLAADSQQAVFQELIDAVSRELDVPSVSLLMFDKERNRLKVVAYRGLISRYLDDLEIKPGEQITGKVFLTGEAVVLNEVNKQQSPYLELMKRDDLSAAISFPVASKDKVLGVLNISETKDGTEFRAADIEMLSVIVSQAVMALDNIRSIEDREESSRVKALLEQYVSPEVSSILVKNRKNLLDIGGVEELTVLFADIRNFTLLVQHLEPDHLRHFLNSFFDMFSDIVFSHRGMLDKFMGDAALVIFGAPVQVKNPNSSAVTVARKIVAEFEQLRLLWEKDHEVFKKVGLGIGISRGPMFLGNVGSSKRLDYTVIGTDVNIAQRLASITGSGQVLLTDRVVATLDDSCDVREQEPMLLRGMETKVAVFSMSPLEKSKV